MKKKGVKLIAPDKNGILCYQGDCKVIIDPIFKVLQIHPKNFEEYYNISVLFEKKFIQKKNLLFIFGDKNFEDFVLVFKNVEICKRVHDIIYKHKDEEDYIQEEELRKRLLIPIFQKLPQKYSTRFKRIIIDWIEQHEENERMELIKLYKKQKRNIQIMDIKNFKQEPKVKNVRKRRYSETEMSNKNTALNQADKNDSIHYNRSNNIICEDEDVHSKKNRAKYPDVIDKSKFKIVSNRNRNRRKLLIFTSSEKIKCYEYNFHPTKEFFYHKCHKNANGMKAILALDENGNECIKYENKKHRCSLLKYDPKKYEEMKIVKKSDYEIMENSAIKSKKMLIIFDPNDRSQCYEYFWSTLNNKFKCCGCSTKRKYRTAEICHENTDAEYILILNNHHVCEIRKYDPKKYPESNLFVISPNFEIQKKIKDGIERKTLIIFFGNDRKRCYTYYFATKTKIFICNGCDKQKKVSARICQNNDGEDYVILSNVKHVCSPKEYIPQQNEVIIRPPKLKYLKLNETSISKLFIFASNQLCYIFSKYSEQNTKKYYCLGCKKLTKTMKEVCVVVLCQNDGGSNNGGEYYVKMMDNQKHICKPQKYAPKKYETKILKPKDDYILFQKKRNTKDYIRLAVFDSNDKSFCYKFYYNKSKNFFHCSECEKKKAYLTTKIQQDSDGNEYIVTSQMKHVCSPIKVSSILKRDTDVLEKSGLTFEKPKMKEINENQIIRLPFFELQKNAKRVLEKKLIVFYGDDNSLCYEYTCKYYNHYLCKKCKVPATIHLDSEKNNEKYIILGPNAHTCEPVKYVAEKTKIIKSSQFMIFNQDNDSKLTKLVIFTSSTRNECYEYSFIKKLRLFRCSGCYASKKIVSAKILQNSSDEEFVQLLEIDHICAPKKFILEEFQPKIIHKSGFQLYSNRNGKPNSKLFVFDSEKDGFGYEYYLKTKNMFRCNKCSYENKYVTAKLCEKENGEKFVELSTIKHICQSTKYKKV